ncbi:hypothetical protein D3C86_1750470 [compost metagenome]
MGQEVADDAPAGSGQQGGDHHGGQREAESLGQEGGLDGEGAEADGVQEDGGALPAGDRPSRQAEDDQDHAQGGREQHGFRPDVRGGLTQEDVAQDAAPERGRKP